MASRKFNLNAANQMLQKPSADEKKSKPTVSEESSMEESVKKTPLQSILKEIEEPVNNSFNFKFIRREKMVYHTNNDYPMEAIEKLADQILDLGLIHNIEVTYDMDKDVYVIDSGERRTRAIDLLIEKYKNWENIESPEYQKYLKHVKAFEKGYPCKVVNQSENLELDEINTEIRLIIANESAREKDPVQTKKHIDRLNDLYAKRNARVNWNERINVNEEISTKLGIGNTQIKKYKAINNLIPALQEKFVENKITLTEGANFAKLTEEEQNQILQMIDNGDGKKEINDLSQQLNRMKQEIAKSKREIENLSSEKARAEETIQQNEEKTKTLRAEIKKELLENDPNQELIRNLEILLAQANNENQKNKKALEDTKKAQMKKIAELQKILDEKESAALKSQQQLRSEAQLENALTNISREIINLQSAYATLAKDFDVDLKNQNKQIDKLISNLKMITQKKQ